MASKELLINTFFKRIRQKFFRMNVLKQVQVVEHLEKMFNVTCDYDFDEEREGDE